MDLCLFRFCGFGINVVDRVVFILAPFLFLGININGIFNAPNLYQLDVVVIFIKDFILGPDAFITTPDKAF